MFIPIAVGDITIFIPIMASSSSGSVTGTSTSTDGRYDLSWSAVSNASYYQIIITDESGTQRIIKVIGTHYSLAGLSLGSNKIEIQACNASNQCGVSYLAGTVSRSSRVRYQHTDMLGTPVMETDESGNVISRSVYEPFGKRLGGEKAGIGFTGHLQDEDLGLTYMQVRYYDPLIGRFYSNDPIGYTASNPVMSFNRYLYVNNNPYKYTDPNGEFLWGVVIGAGIELTAQISTGQDIDFTDIAIAGAVGAVTGGFAGRAATQAFKGVITASKAVKQTVAVSAIVSGVGSAGQDLANGNSISVTKAAISTVSGAAGGLIGGKVGNSFAGKLDSMSNAGGIASHISTTRSAMVGNTAGQTTSAATGLANKAADLGISVVDKRLKENF
ncbi:RHS repeat-associated core domain-containing protein [Shewanella sp.]|uniref:RHS repeat-associated core domain-containing protein n=1 Tax=Shewanella sp. TaxID=50422 RepID=UPI0025FBE419|nr:RHS repeat-associated core domain-containing protein [Shewanella sp.]